MILNRIAQAITVVAILVTFPVGEVLQGATSGEDAAIRPYEANPWYWQYQGNPVVLIGGSDIDCPFQWAASRLTDHLDLMVASGGNYIRNTMSDRNEGDIYAFKRLESGAYDLNQWNDQYWDQLKFFLEETSKRGIIVQLTLWDHFDIGAPQWAVHPWNPENNVNMSPGSWTGRRDFYATLERNDQEGLGYQQRYVDKILSLTLEYGNVLYNINNESDEGALWENYWAQYINRAAAEKGRRVHVTTLQFDATGAVRHVLTYPEIFSFVDISQSSQDSRGARGPAHWDMLIFLRQKIASHPDGPRPMNHEKVYGGADGVNYSAGSETEAVNRLWRNIFAGAASARFHRPALPRVWGSGLNPRVQTNLKAMRMFLEEFDIFTSQPHNDLLVHRVPVPSTMEAYVSASVGKQYAVYFPAGRYTVELDPWVFVDKVRIRWLDIDQLRWSEPQMVDIRWEGSRQDWGYRGSVWLTTPSNRSYVALIEVVEESSRLNF
jgi:hypothetical protein